MLQPAQQNFHLHAEPRQVLPEDPEEHYPKNPPSRFSAVLNVVGLIVNGVAEWELSAALALKIVDIGSNQRNQYTRIVIANKKPAAASHQAIARKVLDCFPG